MGQRSRRAKRAGRARSPERAKVRSEQRERWTGGKPGHGLYLPIAEGLTEADLGRLETAARKQLDRNRARLNRGSA